MHRSNTGVHWAFETGILCLSLLCTSIVAHAADWESVRGVVAIRGTATDGSLYVAAASNGIWTSGDLKSWQRASLPSSAGITYDDVIWDGGRFIAVGNGVISSPDGAAWSTVSKPGDIVWRGITVKSGTYVVVGDSGKVLRSTDGAHWNLVDTGLAAATNHVVNLSGIGNDGGMFVASGEDDIVDPVTGMKTTGADIIATSNDGQSWTPVTLTSTNGAFATNGNTMAIGGGTYFAGGSFFGYTSPDGSTWTFDDLTNYIADPNAPVWLFNRAAYVNGQFMAVGLDIDQVSGDDHIAVFKSADGVSWTSHDLAVRGSSIFGISGISYNSGTYVLAGYQGVYTSHDAASWNKVFAGPQSNLGTCLLTGDGKFTVPGSSGAYTSGNGTDWSSTLSSSHFSTSAGQGCGAYGAGVFVSGSGQPHWSKDGKTWTAVSGIAVTSGIRSIAWDGSRFLAAGANAYGGVFTSSDGKNWTSHGTTGLPAFSIDANMDGTGAGLVYGSGHYVMWGYVQDAPTVFTSTDGLAWNTASLNGLPLDGRLASVAYGNGTFVAIGNDSDGGTLLFISSDATSWQAVKSTIKGVTWNTLASGDNGFLAGGIDIASARGKLLSGSSDGKTWTATVLDTAGINSIAWDGERYLAISFYDVMHASAGSDPGNSSGGGNGGASGGNGGSSSGGGGGGAFSLMLLALLAGFTALRRRSAG